MECENELALFVIQGIEKNRQMATRDTMNWFCGCGELPSTVQKYEELFIVAQKSKHLFTLEKKNTYIYIYIEYIYIILQIMNRVLEVLIK